MPEELENIEPDIYAPFMAGAWIEVTAQDLTTLMPEDAKWARVYVEYDEDGDAVDFNMLPFGEFTLSKTMSLDGLSCLVRIAAQQAKSWRQHRVNRADLVEWDTFLTTLGYTLEDWMTKAEAMALRSSDKYNKGE